ncbi:hypothetical protein ElyMa_000735800 [Elysia marginata]|uniref:Uncharacterized protein n=1 Tax=Elysia marginata TaxID=1093978 RepID=A0AAV4GND1_9GAST|nr:hypothetical protein ElyMa_000735800 [Elysia marginata]
MNKLPQKWSQNDTNTQGDRYRCSATMGCGTLPELPRRSFGHQIHDQESSMELTFLSTSGDVIMWSLPGLTKKCPPGEGGGRHQTQASWAHDSHITGACDHCKSKRSFGSPAKACYDLARWGLENLVQRESHNYFSGLFAFNAVQLPQDTKSVERNSAIMTQHECNSKQRKFSKHAYPKPYEIISESEFSGCRWHRNTSAACDCRKSTSSFAKPQFLHAGMSTLVLVSFKSSKGLVCDRYTLIAQSFTIRRYILAKCSFSLKQPHEPYTYMSVQQTSANSLSGDNRLQKTESEHFYSEEDITKNHKNNLENKCDITLRSLKEHMPDLRLPRKCCAVLQNCRFLLRHIRNAKDRIENHKSSSASSCDFLICIAIDLENTITYQMPPEKVLREDQCLFENSLMRNRSTAEWTLKTRQTVYGNKLRGEKTTSKTYPVYNTVVIKNFFSSQYPPEKQSKSQVILRSHVPQPHHLTPSCIPDTCRSLPADDNISVGRSSILATETTNVNNLLHFQEIFPQPSRPRVGNIKVDSLYDEHTWRHSIAKDQDISKGIAERNAKSIDTKRQFLSALPVQRANLHTSRDSSHIQPVILFQVFALWLFSSFLLKASNRHQTTNSGRTIGKTKYTARICLPLVLLYISFLLGLSSVAAQGLVVQSVQYKKLNFGCIDKTIIRAFPENLTPGDPGAGSSAVTPKAAPVWLISTGHWFSEETHRTAVLT